MNLNNYKYKTELHAHTSPASPCSQIPPEDEVRIYAELGYTSIVISNHFFPGMRFYGDKNKAVEAILEDYHLAYQYGKQYGINVILGCEIRFSENFNDYLLFGIDEAFLYDAYDYLSGGIEEFSKWFRNDSRVLIQAHPFRNGMTEVNPSFLDGIESFNVHPGHNSQISIAARYAKEHNFIVSVGTDYHHPTHEGLSSMLSTKPIKDSFDLARVLRSRDYLFEMSGNIILPYGITDKSL